MVEVFSKMLKVEQSSFIVFPSWLEPKSYSWETVADVLSDPLQYNEELAMNYPLEWRQELGFPDHPPSFSLMPGPLGGGIIEVHAASLSKWLPYYALTFPEGVALTVPGAMIGAAWRGNVSYLENHTAVDTLNFGRKRKNYALIVTPEYVDVLSDSLYWLFMHKGMEAVLEEIPAIGEYYKLAFQKLPYTPRSLELEMRARLRDTENCAWFEGKVEGKGFGYHFAVLLYAGLCLCPLMGKRLISCHLLAAIEGRPRFSFV